MKIAMVFMLLMADAFSQVPQSHQASTSDGLVVELRTNSNRVQLTDDLAITVLFRSPGKTITIWNALIWGVTPGLQLRVLDSSGHEVDSDYRPLYDFGIPDTHGRNALMSIGGNRFAGFDSRIPAKWLFHKPGRYTIKCVYAPTLSRHYFVGHTIWGKEDGAIESAAVPITVEAR